MPTISPLTGLTYAESLDRDGYIKIPEMLTRNEINQLQLAAERSIELGRTGEWPHCRTLFKQFPPWTDNTSGIWGIEHLMHPDLPDHQLFIQSYFNRKLILVVKELLGDAKDEELVMELYNMLIRPEKDFELRWHRDDIRPDATAEQELEQLNQQIWHTQWNLALFEDRSLIVVPGSHKRARTEVERNAEPYAVLLPGMKVVHLLPGDAIFYNNNILHRGVYDSTRERMTLHGSMGHVNGKGDRARNVLQHGVKEWISRIDFDFIADDHQRKLADDMRSKLIDIGQKCTRMEYSQPDE